MEKEICGIKEIAKYLNISEWCKKISKRKKITIFSGFKLYKKVKSFQNNFGRIFLWRKKNIKR